MILDISDSAFKKIFDEENLFLPIRWDGTDFAITLRKLFNYYVKRVELMIIDEERSKYNWRCLENIEMVCSSILKAVNHYFNGFPSKAYNCFEDVMRILMREPLQIYQKSIMEQFNASSSKRYNEESLSLFRVVSVGDDRPYPRTRIFHTPYNLRSKVSSSRYSIAGYPSLYLGTSLELCCEEIHLNPHYNFTLAAIYRLERTVEYTNTNIRVIELGIKPQDFFEKQHLNQNFQRYIPNPVLDSKRTKSTYLLWYPLIAACSYIRTNRNDPFAAEYIIPQLLMQWVRNEMDSNKIEHFEQLVGIRYFSCASQRASDMGFNYVFPTSGQQQNANCPYCAVLAKSFQLTRPTYLHEHDTVHSCEWYLKNSKDYDFIEN